jgi:hypothetical protein
MANELPSGSLKIPILKPLILHWFEGWVLDIHICDLSPFLLLYLPACTLFLPLFPRLPELLSERKFLSENCKTGSIEITKNYPYFAHSSPAA